MFAYIAGSPFVLQDIYGASPQQFSAVFTVNALGIMGAGRLGAQLVGPRLTAPAAERRAGDERRRRAHAAGRGGGRRIGLILPNATALALELHPDAAGSASGAIGVAQFALAALLAPLVGAGGDATALPMALVIAACGVGAIALAPR